MEERVKDDSYYLKRMLDYIGYIEKYAANIRKKKIRLKANNQESDGVIYKFIQLREESTKITPLLLKNSNSLDKQIKKLNGFRNRLTHDYENVSYSFFDENIDFDLPKLKNTIQEVLENIDCK